MLLCLWLCYYFAHIILAASIYTMVICQMSGTFVVIALFKQSE